VYFYESTKPIDKFVLRHLELEARKQLQRTRVATKHEPQTETVKSFSVSSVSCGAWDYDNNEQLIFVPEFTVSKPGELTFGKMSLRLLLQSGQRIDISYSSINTITVGGYASKQSLTVACQWAPKFSEVDIAAMLAAMVFGKPTKKTKRTRISAFSTEHEKAAASCFVYRFELSSVLGNLAGIKFPPELPSVIHQQTRVQPVPEGYAFRLQRLMAMLSSQFTKPSSFPIVFQLQKLAQNGYLSPLSVMTLVPEIIAMSKRSGVAVTAEAVRRMFYDLAWRGPDEPAWKFKPENLYEILKYNGQYILQIPEKLAPLRHHQFRRTWKTLSP